MLASLPSLYVGGIRILIAEITSVIEKGAIIIIIIREMIFHVMPDRKVVFGSYVLRYQTGEGKEAKTCLYKIL